MGESGQGRRLRRLLVAYSVVAVGITAAGVLMLAAMADATNVDDVANGPAGLVAAAVLCVGLALLVYSAWQWAIYAKARVAAKRLPK
jgi:uncharacterized membrane protein